MARLVVTQPDPDELRFRVRVEPEIGTATDHEIIVSESTLASLGWDDDVAAFVEASFGYLLEREPNTAILRSFDADEIARYFPGFPEAIRRR